MSPITVTHWKSFAGVRRPGSLRLRLRELLAARSGSAIRTLRVARPPRTSRARAA